MFQLVNNINFLTQEIINVKIVILLVKHALINLYALLVEMDTFLIEQLNYVVNYIYFYIYTTINNKFFINN